MKYSQTSPKEEFDLLWLKLFPVDDPDSAYGGFQPGTTVLKKGQVMEEGRMPLPCDILCERDKEIVLRDGIKLYADVYRPVDSGPDNRVPAIMNWNPAGKQGRHDMTHPMTKPEDRAFPKDAVSNLQVWLCNDPARWVPEGYAVVSVDPRGVYMSEGDMHYFGQVDALDGCESMKWIASQDWCSGSIGMAGNAYTCIEQWFMAAQNPPELKAIAPWEGHGDFYREEFIVGGIPKEGDTWMRRTYGSGRIEFIQGMAEKYPIYNEYWESKRVDPAKISVPAYVVASYTNNNHTRGTINMFNGLASKDKWLRIHNISETAFFRIEENRRDLQRFFDHYLKGIDNGWETTPRVRMAVLDHGREDIIDRPETEFPPARRQLKRLYLNDGGILTENAQAKESEAVYRCVRDDCETSFTYTFTEKAEFTGFSKLHLWLEARGAEDMDVFIKMRKLSADGEVMYCNFFKAHPGQAPGGKIYSAPHYGRLRVSMRKTDPEKSTEDLPFYPFNAPQLLKPGETVEADIAITPTAMMFYPGEKLEVTLTSLDPNGAGSGTRDIGFGSNRGEHVIHYGGRYGSYLLLPVIPD